MEYAEKFIDMDMFVDTPNASFNTFKESSWFKDEFVQEIIRDIDGAYMEGDFAVHSLKYDEGYSVNDLSGGAKLLILAYCLRDYVYLAMMGDNCTDFLERISLEYEKEGKDLVIVSNYLHRFKFNYVDSIEYLNWNIICNSCKDIDKKICSKWIEQERAGVEDDDDDSWMDEVDHNNPIIKMIDESLGIK